MTADTTVAAVSAIFAEAGWRPMPAPPRAGLFCAASSDGYWLGGIAPNGAVHSSHTHMTDPPQDAEKIARSLVAAEGRKYRFKRKATETVLPPPRIVLDEPEELAEDSGDEKVRFSSAGEGQGDCEEALSERLDNEHRTNVEERSLVRDAGQENPHEDSRPDFVDDSTNPIDAEFSEPAPELGQELAEEHPEEFGGAAFIFGDNLDQKRTAAIGLVMRHARSLMPFWTTNEDVMLRELRNYAAGVGEGRWPYDEGRRRELDALEAALARMNDIARVRDEKVSFLEQAKREEIEAFDPEAGWPQ
ncbi:MAG TPA: hypothetical protein PLV48_15315 [Rhodocyclaceae bacterium]|nr:hypothetical protein [Rhodocyclaceae bacterium]